MPVWVIEVLMLPAIVAIMTLVFNLVLHWGKTKFEYRIDTTKFRREHDYLQLSELYMELYAVIAQSEFLRVFHHLEDLSSLQDLPFVEVEQRLKRFEEGLFPGEFQVHQGAMGNAAIHSFNKMQLVELIMEKKPYASQKLIKLAVGYRYCHEFLNKDGLVEAQYEKFLVSGLEYIYKIVTTVVRETNEKRESCHLEFIESEKHEGIMELDIYKLKHRGS